MPRKNSNAFARVTKPIEGPIPQCSNCDADNSVSEIEDGPITGNAYFCMECGYWGTTVTDMSNPPPDDDHNPTGQISRKPTT